jgi:hypothetical protein
MKYKYRFLTEFGSMPARIRKRSNETDINRSKGMGSVEMSFDVAEWLEGERLEHERRMQELGSPCKSTEEPSEASDKQHRKSRRTKY